jgi:hypothetical protein
MFELTLVLSLALAVSVGGVAFLWPRTFASGYPIFSSFAFTTGVVERSDIRRCGSRGERVDLTYRYSVNGYAYEGNKLMHADCVRYSRARLEEVQRAFLPGDSVIVYYNPTQPEYSVLRKDFPLDFIVAPIIAVVCTLCLALMARSRIRRLQT